MSMKLVWLIIAIVFGVGELLTPSLTLIWFSIGAFISIFLSSFIDNIVYQIVIFGIISVIPLVIVTKKMVKKDASYKYNTNLQGIISKPGIVKIEILPNKPGIVLVSSEEWTAISVDNEKIEAGSTVEIVKIEGVKLVVKSKKYATNK